MVSNIKNVFKAVWNDAICGSFVDLHLYLLFVIQSKGVPRSSSGCSTWSRMTRLITSGEQTASGDGGREQVLLDFIILWQPNLNFHLVFLLLFLVCSQSDTRSLDCFARIHPLPRTPTPPSVMKRWSTSCGSSWTQVGGLNCWPPRSNVVSCFKVDHILTSYGFNSIKF